MEANPCRYKLSIFGQIWSRMTTTIKSDKKPLLSSNCIIFKLSKNKSTSLFKKEYKYKYIKEINGWTYIHNKF